MGIFDDMTNLVGRGMNAADRKTQQIKLQSELNALEEGRRQALAELGQAVYDGERKNLTFSATYAEQMLPIDNIQAQEVMLRQQLEALGSFAIPASLRPGEFACPVCGAPVAPGSAFCTSCGTDRETLLAQLRRCPNCDAYYLSGTRFCERCGSETVEARPQPQPVPGPRPQQQPQPVSESRPQPVREPMSSVPA